MAVPEQREPIVPHPVLSDFYATEGERSAFVRRLFNDTAPYYDSINRTFSLGSGRWYRRRCLREAGLHGGMRVLDIATGTGVLACEAAAITGNLVVGLDLSEAMLAEAKHYPQICLIQGRAEALPVASEAVEFVSMGYALRHVSDLVIAFREFNRVLRPGGTIMLLEIAKPGRAFAQALASFYLGRMVPFICRFKAGGTSARTLMNYYWETIENCVPPARIIDSLADAGFVDIACNVDLGVFRNYVGRKLFAARAE